MRHLQVAIEYSELIVQVKDNADKWAIIKKAYYDPRISWMNDGRYIMELLEDGMP